MSAIRSLNRYETTIIILAIFTVFFLWRISNFPSTQRTTLLHPRSFINIDLQEPMLATDSELLDPTTSFPPKIWHKAGQGVAEDAHSLIQLWLFHNPYFRHEVLTDYSADEYVQERYDDWPEVLNTFLALRVPIIKADFLRLLVLYADGGIWSDLDVSCEMPVKSWIPAVFDHKVNAVVGIEFDGWQFAGWTVMAKPHLVHFRETIKYVLGQLDQIAEMNDVSISGITMEMIPDVGDTSGSQAMTVALLRSLSETTGGPIVKSNISGLYELTLLGDILVLPQAAFAARQGDFPTGQGPALVRHLYADSRRNKTGGQL